MIRLLFVHGGCHGAWCWDPLIHNLENLGQKGYALDLPGHGLDRTPRQDVTFSSYVEKLSQFIEEKDLSKLVLVGHSLAGIILPEIASRFPERIQHLVYLAAFVLNEGESAIELVPTDRRQSYFDMSDQSPEKSISLDFETAYRRFFSDLDQGDARQFYARLTPQPLEVYLQVASVSPCSLPQRLTYIICKNDGALTYELCASLAEKLTGDKYEIESDHDVMLSHPEELADLLIRIAA